MDKKKLIPGHKYLRKRKTIYAGKEVEAESWLECIQITSAGAVFFGAAGLEKLTDKQIRDEIIREA
ncbi:hypothetical protein [Blautia argi]|uniref:hypothetical protein n=1 Tax=Blautia argi TaxID=1912897 RepID=UPI002942AF35|nr:hypothetical protein [Blautia argi]